MSRTYTAISTNQTGQNYDALVYGDDASTYVFRPEGSTEIALGDDLASTVAAVILPDVAVDKSKSSFVAAVTTSAIDAKNNLVGFQGDFTFDERVVRFEGQPVQKAGLTGGNWNVSGNVLDGPARFGRYGSRPSRTTSSRCTGRGHCLN